MRMAFLPVVMALAGGVAWGQSAAGATNPAMLVNRQIVPGVQTAQLSSALTLALLRSPRPERPAASRLEPIPTQWPHAKLEPIPTQWKAKVMLVAPGQRAGRSAGSAASVPK